MKKYQVVIRDDHTKFEIAVNRELAAGWRLAGGFVVLNNNGGWPIFHQPMVRFDDKP